MSGVVQRFVLRMLALSMLTLLAGCGVSDAPTTQTPPSPTAQSALGPALTGPELDATKAALMEQQQDEIATYAALPSPTPGTLPTPTSLPTMSPLPTPLGGITFDCIGFLPQVIKHANCWFGTQDGSDVAVFTGSARQEPAQGLMIIKLRTLGSAVATEVTSYTTPEKRGRIMLEQVDYPRFFLRADEGTLFIFNVESRQWEETSAVALPTDVPMPTSTPVPAMER